MSRFCNLQSICCVFLLCATGWTEPDLSAQELPPADLSHPFLKVDLKFDSTPAGIPEIDEEAKGDIKVAELGRQLFFDPLLSSDGSTSCATCHRPEHGFSIPDPIGEGVNGTTGKRHPPVILNRYSSDAQFWDGRAGSLEEQALQPLESDEELNSSIEEVMQKLAANPDYQKKFSDIFDDGLTRTNLANAIAGFERILVTGDSPIDRFVTARESVLTKSERQGLWLYESKGGCWQCHSGQNYSDEQFHNTGVSWGLEPLDLGRFEHTKDESHKGQFKTPTLRNVASSAPYMHNGSMKTLREVVEFYNKGGNDNPHLDKDMRPLNLSENEVDDLVAFLKALDGRYAWEKPVDRKTETTEDTDAEQD